MAYAGSGNLWVIVCWLIMYMFLSANFFMMLAQRKISWRDPANAIGQIAGILSKAKNPKDYFLARLYFFGSICVLFAGGIFLAVKFS